MFHVFYQRIEQIQGIYYKTETVDQIKSDLPTFTDTPYPNVNYDESRLPESSAEDGFDDISVDNYTDGISPMKITWNFCTIACFMKIRIKIFADFVDQKEINPPEVKIEGSIAKSSKENGSKRKNKSKPIKDKSFG